MRTTDSPVDKERKGDGMDGHDTWAEWQRHVLAELQRQGEKIDCLDAKLTDVRIEVGKVGERVTVRATLVGFLAGGLPVLALLVFRLLK